MCLSSYIFDQSCDVIFGSENSCLGVTENDVSLECFQTLDKPSCITKWGSRFAKGSNVQVKPNLRLSGSLFLLGTVLTKHGAEAMQERNLVDLK